MAGLHAGRMLDIQGQEMVMHRSHLVCFMLFLAVAAAVPSSCLPQVLQAKKKNILFILADDMRCDTIAKQEPNTHIVTPNLDKLAKRGTFFTRAYIQGGLSGAVCMPSRAMIMTGRYFAKTPLNMKGVPVLGEVLQPEPVYITFATGKWHNEQDSWLRSFEMGKAVYFGGMADHYNVAFQNPVGGGKFAKYNAKGKHSSEVVAVAAIDFLKGRGGADKSGCKPFFMYVAFTAPHDPRDAPAKYRDMYYKKKPPLPKSFLPQHPFDNGELVGRDENLVRLASRARRRESRTSLPNTTPSSRTWTNRSASAAASRSRTAANWKTRSSSTPAIMGWRSGRMGCSASRMSTSIPLACR